MHTEIVGMGLEWLENSLETQIFAPNSPKNPKFLQKIDTKTLKNIFFSILNTSWLFHDQKFDNSPKINKISEIFLQIFWNIQKISQEKDENNEDFQIFSNFKLVKCVGLSILHSKCFPNALLLEDSNFHVPKTHKIFQNFQKTDKFKVILFECCLNEQIFTQKTEKLLEFDSESENQKFLLQNLQDFLKILQKLEIRIVASQKTIDPLINFFLLQNV